uniref:MPL proto-oncogene, thrombopoietin receptor n=1 Tax=Electrophorus electricus TaxID=8005 RepID=A0A4W4F1Q6_ELEEL
SSPPVMEALSIDALSVSPFADQVLLSAEENPKCFTRNLVDFTCFWEALVGTSYDFIYITDEGESRCNISQQDSEDSKVLHVYSRVCPYSFSPVLLYPPSNISFNLTGEAGQMLLMWSAPKEPKALHNQIEYEMHYSYRTSQVDNSCCKKCTVKMRLKPSKSVAFDGHWSDWSPAITAMVPQPAGERCHTPDLHQIQCTWNEELYEKTLVEYDAYDIFFRNIWESWNICGKASVSAIQCVFYGDESTIFKVYLRVGFEPLSRTFYKDIAWMNKSSKSIVKTEAPGGLQEKIDGGRLCLRWSCPLPLISQHLMYEVRYQLQGETGWKVNAKTNTCLDIQTGSQYAIQVKSYAQWIILQGAVESSGPNLSWYNCHQTQVFKNALYLFIAKLKQFLWPPVPNLNEVLENFLKDINEQNWEPKFSVKMCDDTPATVVEVMSESESQLMRKPSRASNCPLLMPQASMAADSIGEYSQDGLEVSREYVTLNTNVLPCLTGNDYVYSMNASPDLVGERLCCCSSSCSTTFSASTTSILNHSYLQSEFGRVNPPACHYTNLENTETARVKSKKEQEQK